MTRAKNTLRHDFVVGLQPNVYLCSRALALGKGPPERAGMRGQATANDALRRFMGRISALQKSLRDRSQNATRQRDAAYPTRVRPPWGGRTFVSAPSMKEHERMTSPEVDNDGC